MRFIIYGAGAIGGTLGGLLFRAGHEVVLIARGRHLQALRSDGLTLSTPDFTDTYSIPAVADPSEVDWSDGDVVLLTMKSQHTLGALTGDGGAAGLAGQAPPDTPVVSLQNGVANELTALRLFPRVYGVCVMFPATHLEPGAVQADCSPVPALLDIGRYPGGVDDTAERIAAAFRSAGCGSEPRANVMAWKYHKLLSNLANSLDALCGDHGDRDDSREVLGQLAERARAEGREVLTAAGIAVISDQEDRERRGDLLRVKPVVGGVSRQGSSTRQSLLRGSGSVEADYLNGEIVLLGRQYGVPTPVNELLQRLIGEHVRLGREPGAFTPEQLLARL